MYAYTVCNNLDGIHDSVYFMEAGFTFLHINEMKIYL